MNKSNICIHTNVDQFSFQISSVRKWSKLWQNQQTKGQVKRVDSYPHVSLLGNQRLAAKLRKNNIHFPKLRVELTICSTTRSVKGTSSVKTLELLLGDMCSRTLNALILQSATDKTSEGNVMFIKATSEPKGPSSTLNSRSSGIVSVGQ